MSIYQNLPSQPFLYVIGWTQHDRWYLGSRYKAGCQTSDIWTRYFTSSKYVAEFRRQHGEPDHIEVVFMGDPEEVRSWEHECIADFNLHTDPKWLNRGTAGLKFHKPDMTSAATRKKISKAGRGRKMRKRDAEWAAKIVVSRERNGWTPYVRDDANKRKQREAQTLRYVTINGVSRTYKDWSEIVGISTGAFKGRVSRGWTGEKLLQPPR